MTIQYVALIFFSILFCIGVAQFTDFKNSGVFVRALGLIIAVFSGAYVWVLYKILEATE